MSRPRPSPNIIDIYRSNLGKDPRLKGKAPHIINQALSNQGIDAESAKSLSIEQSRCIEDELKNKQVVHLQKVLKAEE